MFSTNTVTIALLSLLYMYPAIAHQKTGLTNEVLAKYVPSEFLKDSDGNPQTLESGIDATSIPARFDKKSKDEYFVLQYRTQDERCRIQVIRQEGKKYRLTSPTTMASLSSLDGCISSLAVDLDQDGIDEIMVRSSDGRTVLSPVFFRWNKDGLEEITPRTTTKENAFRNVTVYSRPVQSKLLIFDNPDEGIREKSRVYSYDKGRVGIVGEYDMVTYVANEKRAEPQSFEYNLSEAGSYVIAVKNVSDHRSPVRVEIVVNDSVVLKPTDFCKTGLKKKHGEEDRLKSKKNDDGWDKDDDNCKHCDSVPEAYAIVNLKDKNVFKVKVFGEKKSLVQLTVQKR
jgi:hypothetical protein